MASFEADELDVNIEDELQFGCEESVVKGYKSRLDDLGAELGGIEKDLQAVEAEVKGEKSDRHRGAAYVDNTTARLSKLSEAVLSVEGNLRDLMDSQRLKQMQEEAESEGEELEDSLPSSAAVEIFSRCQNLHLSAQEFMTRIEELSMSLKEHKVGQRETILRDLESFEAWLQQAYDTILREPSRHLYPPSLVDEELMRAQSLSSVCTTEGEGTPRTDSAQNGAAAAAAGDIGKNDTTVGAQEVAATTDHTQRELHQMHGEETTRDDGEEEREWHDEGEVNGMDPGGGGGGEELKEGEEEISPTDSGETEEGVSSEWTQSGSEVESLGWIRDLHLLPMVHALPPVPTPPPTSPTSTCSTSSSLWDLRRNSTIIADLDHLIADVQKLTGELPIQSQKVKKLKANLNYIIHSVGAEQAEEYRARLHVLQARWDLLEAELSTREAELEFEKEQKEILESMHEAVRELEGQPFTNLRQEEVEEKYSNLMEFIIGEDQFTDMKEVYVQRLEKCLKVLETTSPESPDKDRWREMVDTVIQGYEALDKRVREQKLFLEKCRELWISFQKVYSACYQWLESAELLVTRETYGYTLQEVKEYLEKILALKQTIQQEEEQGEELVSLGKTMLLGMEEGGEAEKFIDDSLSGVESRLEDLVAPGKGKIETRKSDVEKVMSEWEGYNGLMFTLRAFVSQMSKMVGPEPKEELSHSNTTLIPTYVTYRNQIRGMEVQYKRLVASGEWLAANEHMKSHALFSEELKNLKTLWEPLKDNVLDTLDLLIREYNDWILVKLQHTRQLVEQGEGLVRQAQSFVAAYPLTDVLAADVEALLRETDRLVANQEVLSQLEAECGQVEEVLLERQIQQETAAGFSGSQCDLEYPSTMEEKDRMQAARERVQADSDALLPVLSVMYSQLQLLQSVQECLEVINLGLVFVGSQTECERFLDKLDESLLSDRFDKLKGQVFDVGTVLEETQEGSEEQELPACFPRENFDKMQSTNKLLGSKVEQLQSSCNEARTRLQVIVQWWEEFHANYNDVLPWMEGAEADLNELSRRHSYDEVPRFSPITLLRQLKSLSVEVEEKSLVVCAVESTSGNILEEMSLKGVNPRKLPQEAEFVRAKWEELREKIRHLQAELEPSAESFQTFLTSMSQFLCWLSSFYTKVYDDYCMKIPQDASQELIGQMMNQLEVFRAEVVRKKSDQIHMTDESEKWFDYKVPEDVLSELPSPPEISPDPPSEEDEQRSESVSDTPLLPLVKTCINKCNEKWWRVLKILEEREAELERCSGSYQLFAQQAEKLLEWLQDKLNMNALADMLTADLGVAEGYHKEVKVTRTELELKVATLRALQHMGSELKGHVNAASIAHLEEMLEKMEEVWQKVEKTTETRQEVLEPLVEHLREYNKVSGELEVWLQDKEAKLQECGPIGANLDRCIEQEDILAELYEKFMTHKDAPDKVLHEVKKLCGLCGAESEARIRQQVAEMEERFNSMFEETEEKIEQCEQAKAGMQKLLKEVKKFEEWVEQVEAGLEKRKEVKRPIGTVQTEIDEHYDCMRDIEMHTEDYCALIPPARALFSEYKPSDWLEGVMKVAEDRWFGCVDNLLDRERCLVTLQHQWEKYEGEVKTLLSWIMSEAESFSKDVTTYGEKGIVDHMETCRSFMVVLEGKKDHIDDISEQAVELKKEDAQKKNGTTDVESRWNDVQMHWNSSCKLLTETLVHLEATEEKMRYLLTLRGEEFEWLEECEMGAAIRRRTHGNLELLHQEIERHEGLFEETKEHEEARLFILSTVPFLVEHSRIADRESMTTMAEDFSVRHRKLQDNLEAHTAMLKNSVPFWEKFNLNSKDLELWLQNVNSDLGSEKVQFGNATETEQSLKFCQGLQIDINTRNPDLVDMVLLGEELAKFVVPEDLEFVSTFVQKLRKEEELISKETMEKTELLEERLKSWRVFPVEEARVVQMILDQVKEEDEQDGGESWDDLTSEELLDRLEKLESLQHLKTSNEDKVQTIDQSARDEDVQRALEKNPDISKERSNLLQGWSNVSGSLSERIMVTRKKVELVQRLEHASKEMDDSVRVYQDFLDTPLPPSVLLAHSYKELLEKLVPVHNACRSSLSSFRDMMESSHEAVAAVPGMSMPRQFDGKVATCQDRFSDLNETSDQWKARVLALVASWEEFQGCLDELDEWVRSRESELDSLQVLEEFAGEFSSHQTRLNILRDEIERHRPSFNTMVATSANHIQGQGSEVKEVKEHFNRVESLWHRIIAGVNELTERSKPWVEFTDKFDSFCVWIERLERKVREAEQEVDNMAEEEGGDLSDKIVLFKGYLAQVTEQEDNLAAIKEGAETLLPEEVCERYEECQTTQEESEEMSRRWLKLSVRLQKNLELLDQKERSWKKHAKSSILLVGQLRRDLQDYRKKMSDQDALIDKLRRAPRPAPPSLRPSSPLCRPLVPVIGVAMVVVIAIALVFIKKEQTQFRPM